MQQPPQGGYPPQPGPAKSNAGCLKVGLIVLAVLVVFGLLGVGCLAFGANQVVDEFDKQTGVADSSDYELTGPECVNEEFVGPKATGTLKNTSSEAQGFEVSVRFTDADGNLISEDSTFTDSIDVDQTANWEVSTFESADGEIKCEVAEVNYSLFDG
ncbi:MAG: FxLYD domain-containing protein [Microthrixaceae bacterium]